MKRAYISILTSLVLFASMASAQSWRIMTPRDTQNVLANGAMTTFDRFVLLAGMRYRVNVSGQIKVSNGSEYADGRYYISSIGIPFRSNLISTGLRLNSGAGEDWFCNTPIAPDQYQSSHIYETSVAALGQTLRFRLSDHGDPPSVYYDDNSGQMTIWVARETPGIAIWRDTVFFPPTKVGATSYELDSISSYGVESYRLDNVTMQGATPAVFGVLSERTVPFLLAETTNEFRFSFTPPVSGNFSARMHLFSPTAGAPDRERIIYLIAQGINSDIIATPDTLDFGTIAAGDTKTLNDTLINRGSAGAVAQSIAITQVGSAFSVASVLPQPVPSGGGEAVIPVTFAPTLTGGFFARFDVTIDDGKVITFYAKGQAGMGLPFFASGDTLDFGKVVLGYSKTLQDTFTNKGNAPLTQNNITVFNSAEYYVNSNLVIPYTYSQGSGNIFQVTFTPTTHIPNYGNHDGHYRIFFTDQGPKTLYFLGADHEPLSAHLEIPRHYYVYPGGMVTLSQYLVADLTESYQPINSLSETINFDASLFDFIKVEKGTLTSGNEWIMNAVPGAGRVDIAISSTTGRFTNGGELVRVTLRAKTTAQTNVESEVPQTRVDFSNNIEPLASTSNGLIIIADECSPARLRSDTSRIASFIEQNSPNPFNPTTRIRYEVGGTAEGMQNVSLKVYDALGRLVRTIVDEPKSEGIYEVTFNAAELQSGVYTYVYEAGEYRIVKKMMLAK